MTDYVLASLFIFSAAFSGGILPLVFPGMKESRLKLFVSFGAGVLLGMALLHMIPEASVLVPHDFGLWLLGGFMILFVLERFVMVHACEEHSCDYHKVGMAAFAGLTVHGVIEGFAMASSLFVESIAPIVLIGILSHKAPATIALSSILKLSGKTKSQVLLFVAGISLATPLGIFVAYHFTVSGTEQMAGRLLALSAGTFLYIATCDLIPEIHRSEGHKTPRFLAFLLGLAICLWSGYQHDHHAHHHMHDHSHDHGHHDHSH